MNRFLNSCIRLITRHGIAAQIVQVQEGVYDPETLSTTNTETVHNVVLFKRHIKVDQYNYPNLIGKDAAEFYLANNSLGFKPSPQDKILYAADEFTIASIKEHWAVGELCMYQLIAVRN